LSSPAAATLAAVTHAGFYRVKTADGEQQNALLEIGVDGDPIGRRGF